MSKYDIALKLAEEALSALITGTKHRATGNEMLDWIRENRAESISEIQSSWGSWLTRATEDPKSRVMREPGKYGYMLRPLLKSEPVVVSPNSIIADLVVPQGQEESKRIERERKLWGWPKSC